jgi:hypothetical protein
MRMWKKDEMRGSYTVQLTIAGGEYVGKADLPQLAKHYASEQAIPILESLPDASNVSALLAKGAAAAAATTAPAGGGGGGVGASAVVAAASVASSDPEVAGGKNPIMRVNEIAMTHGLCVEWDMISEQVRRRRKFKILQKQRIIRCPVVVVFFQKITGMGIRLFFVVE